MLAAEIGGFHHVTLEEVRDSGHAPGAGDVGEHGDAMPVKVVEVVGEGCRVGGSAQDLLEAGLQGRNLDPPGALEVAAAGRGNVGVGGDDAQTVLALDVSQEGGAS